VDALLTCCRYVLAVVGRGVSQGAGMGVKPFFHVGLILVFSRLVFEYVGDLVGFFVIVGGHRGLQWWGSTWDAE
jgi:hypothetical protein